MSELLNCPFCGGRPIAGARFDWGYVKCSSESCWVRPNIRRKDDATQGGAAIAMDAWNRRTAQPVTLPACRYTKTPGELGSYSSYAEGYDAALADVQQALHAAGIPFKETT